MSVVSEITEPFPTSTLAGGAAMVVARSLRCGEDDDFDEDDESFVDEHGVSSEDDFDEDDFDDDFDDDFEEEIDEELVASDDDSVPAVDADDEEIEFEDDE